MPPRLRLPLALLAGLVLATGQPPLNLWPLALAGLAGGLWLFARCPSAPAAAWTGWTMGAGYFGASMSWIVHPFLVESAVTGVLAPLGVIGLGGGLALFWALAWGLARRLALGLPGLVALWALAELARAYVLTGFPWGLVGYVLAPSPGVYWTTLTGPHGLSLLALGAAALAAGALLRRSAAMAGAAALALAVILGGGALLRPALPATPPDAPVIRMVQPNAPQHLKWHPDHIRGFFRTAVEATAAGAPPDLILWPETAVPSLLHDAATPFEIILDAARGAQVALGIQRFEGGYRNSLALLDGSTSPTAIYDKHHLVPFGEYMPFPDLFRRIDVAGLAVRADSGFVPGPGPRLIDTRAGRALPLICYEAVFPQDVLGAPERPDYLLQLTNDAWFGTWSGPYQHLMQARLRAIETGLPLVRAANTGVSAMIAPDGTITASLGLGQAGYVDAALPPALPPTLYARTGDALAAALMVLLLGVAAARRLRNPH